MVTRSVMKIHSYITVTATCNILQIFLIYLGIRSTGARHWCINSSKKIDVKVLRSRYDLVDFFAAGINALMEQISDKCFIHI